MKCNNMNWGGGDQKRYSGPFKGGKQYYKPVNYQQIIILFLNLSRV